jgi:hypothetical protein
MESVQILRQVRHVELCSFWRQLLPVPQHLFSLQTQQQETAERVEKLRCDSATITNQIQHCRSASVELTQSRQEALMLGAVQQLESERIAQVCECLDAAYAALHRKLKEEIAPTTLRLREEVAAARKLLESHCASVEELTEPMQLQTGLKRIDKKVRGNDCVSQLSQVS